MSAVDQNHTQLGAYALGALDPAEAAEFEQRHLATCAQCRFDLNELMALRESLDEVPPEAFLDGPPEGGDMLLQRTLRQVRAEEPAVTVKQRPRRGLALAGAAVLVVVALGGGVVVGRQTAGGGGNIAIPGGTATPQPGTKEARATDPNTGVQLAASVAPFSGWVDVKVSVKGIPAGEQCVLQVVGKNGQVVGAGSWKVSPKWESEGFTLEGAALMAPDDVQSIDIATTDGRKLVSVPI
jgi:hypothetical protein